MRAFPVCSNLHMGNWERANFIDTPTIPHKVCFEANEIPHVHLGIASLRFSLFCDEKGTRLHLVFTKLQKLLQRRCALRTTLGTHPAVNVGASMRKHDFCSSQICILRLYISFPTWHATNMRKDQHPEKRCSGCPNLRTHTP